MKTKKLPKAGSIEENAYLADKAMNYTPPKTTDNTRLTFKNHLPALYHTIMNEIRYKSDGTFTHNGKKCPIILYRNGSPCINIDSDTIYTHEILACKFLELDDDFNIYIVHIDGNKLNHERKNLKFFDSKYAVQKYYFDLRQAKKNVH